MNNEDLIRAQMQQSMKNAVQYSAEQNPMKNPEPIPSDIVQPPKAAHEQEVQKTAQQEGMSMQDILREQMKNNSSTATPTVMKQGDTYRPTSSINEIPTFGRDSKEQSNQSTQSAQSSTIINTTRQTKKKGAKKGEKDNEDKKLFGITLSKPVIIGVAVTVLVGFILLLSLLGGAKDEEDIVPTTIPTPTEELEWIIEEPPAFSYTLFEVEELRKMGYTGDEIENYESMQYPYDSLVKEATAKRDEWIQEAIAPLYDTASDEFKEYVSSTWLSLPERTDMDEWDRIAMNYSKRQNLDYEKVDPHGSQLFVKIYLDDDIHEKYFFVYVSPQEWNKLKDKGNIIVNYTYSTRMAGDREDIWNQYEDTENIIITDATLEFIE